ncbi:hypothetical protein KSP40_PGU001428 [Platanthera guangdongensis]|uniref:C2H2-type domain-containing protein n=1 Tax=Platanthera guangdongensis TaxID=2320717 RepID=A0ABR2MV86_9ASPA
MTKFWHAIKKTLHQKSNFFDVHEAAEAKKGHQDSNNEKTSTCWRFGCSRSISNLKDVVHGCSRPPNPPPPSIYSPRSVGSSDLLDTLAREVVSSSFNKELKITAGHLRHGCSSFGCDGRPPADPAFMGNERDGIFACHYCGKESKKWQDLEAHHACNHAGFIALSYALLLYISCKLDSHLPTRQFENFLGLMKIILFLKALIGLCRFMNISINQSFCYKFCLFLTLHIIAVTELEEGEFSRKIVEKICQSSFSYSIYGRRIVMTERILKVHHLQRTLAKFEEYRESVQNRAIKFQHKHARCIADGNELLRFHGTTISCSLGVNGSSSLCSSTKCNVCQIIRSGFPTKWEMKAGVGVFTASTWETALESIDTTAENNDFSSKKAVVICRVIAGRIHKPIDGFREMIGLMDFDSVAGKVGRHSNLEELYLLNPRALLPCFVVIDKS